MKSFAMLACLIFLGACAKEENKTDYSYELSENGCSTGQRKFSSKDDYCNALKNDSANNFCARGLRYDQFRNNCPDKSWQ